MPHHLGVFRGPTSCRSAAILGPTSRSRSQVLVFAAPAPSRKQSNCVTQTACWESSSGSCGSARCDLCYLRALPCGAFRHLCHPPLSWLRCALGTGFRLAANSAALILSTLAPLQLQADLPASTSAALPESREAQDPVSRKRATLIPGGER